MMWVVIMKSENYQPFLQFTSDLRGISMSLSCFLYSRGHCSHLLQILLKKKDKTICLQTEEDVYFRISGDENRSQ